MMSFRADNRWAALVPFGDNYFEALGEAVCFLRELGPICRMRVQWQRVMKT